MPDAVIRTERLTKFYGRARGIVELDLQVQRGEVFGFLGPNGAGKTTTIRTLLDFIRPTSGRARVLGRDCRRDSKAIRGRVGYLPGEFTLYENLTGTQLLRFLGSLRGGVDWAFVKTLAGRLDSDLSRPIGDLSHGNKQKIGLIQAFMHRPELLILDEPTIGLDPLMQRQFYELVAEVKADGRTMFLSSHILPEVERVCDRIGIVRDGRLVCVDSVSAIKDKSLRRIEMVFDGPVPRGEFADLPGVRDLTIEAGRLRCTVQGSVDPLLKAAARFNVTDITSHEPNLEEIFLALYGHDDRAA